MVFVDEPKETRFVLSQDVYKNVVSRNHLLYRINEEIDFSFVNKECKDLYEPDIGRKVTNYPEIMFRAEIVQYMYCLSERQLRNQIVENLVYRWFVGYELDEMVFHFTAPGKFRNTLGEDMHRTLFNRILEQFKQKSLLDEYENQSIDATHIIADIAIPTTIALVKQAIVSILRSYDGDCPVNREFYLDNNEKKEFKMAEREKRATLKRVVIDAKSLIDHFAYMGVNISPETSEYIEQLKSILNDYIKEVETDDGTDFKQREKKGKGRLVSNVDKDARWGAKSDKKTFCGYKAHTSQTDRQIITDVKVTPGDTCDDSQLPGNLKRQKEKGLSPKKIRADGIYGTIDNRKFAEDTETVLIAPPRTSHNNSEYYSKDKFDYDHDKKKMVCPAGHTTSKHYWNKGNNSWVYFFGKNTCEQCTSKNKCTPRSFRTISINKDYDIQQKAIKYSKTDDYKEDMKIRSHIEPKQAEMKRFHGLNRARYHGLEKVNVQAILTGLVVNLKRMIKLLDSDSYRKQPGIC